MPQTIEVPGYGDVEFPDDMTDDQIASAIKANMPKASAPAENPAQYSGTGGYNPMQSLITGTTQKIGGELGMTPENVSSPLKNALGPAETALHYGTGGLATILGGIAGLGQGAWNLATPKSMNGQNAADAVREVQSSLTYQPRTGAGAGMARASGLPQELYGAGTNYLGEKATDITGSPLVGATVKTAGDAIPALVTRGRSRELPVARGAESYIPTKRSVPTTAEIKVAKDAAYKAADDAGVVIRPESTKKAIDVFQGVADSENLGKLPPDMKEAVTILRDRIAGNKPLSLKDADKVRQKINDAAQSQNASDRRLASIVKDKYDAYLDGLSPQDTLAGNSAEALQILKTARDLNGRYKRSQMLDQMDELASLKGESNYTQASQEHAFRKQYEGLATKAIKGDEYLTPEQLDAVRKVAAPGRGANALRNLSKLDPARGGPSVALNTVVGGGLGAAIGSLLGPWGAGAGAIAGQATLGLGANLAGRGALRGTLGRVAEAREALVGRGVPNVGLSSKGKPTLPAELAKELISKRKTQPSAKVRSAAEIQSDIRRLGARAQFELATEPAGSPRVQLLNAELARLQNELAASQASKRPSASSE